MNDKPVIPAAERSRGQRAALLANIWMPSLNLIMMGPIMMLFANDVLGFDPKTIGTVVGLLPLLIVLRFPLLGFVRRLGLKRTLFYTDCAYFAAVLLLVVLPVDWLTVSTFLCVIMLYKTASVIGPVTVWQPLLRDITTNRDRGRFFARMRFVFSIVTLSMSAGVSLLIGEEIARSEYNILLLISLLGIVNRLYWARYIPEYDHQADREQRQKPLWDIIKSSALLKRPVLVVMLMTITGMPLFVVYLRQVLHVPTNAVSAFVFMSTLGSVASMMLWGRIADAIGFKPMLTGLLIMGICISPLLLLVAPIEADVISWQALSGSDVVSLTVLAGFGFMAGAMNAGTGIASTSIQHAHTNNHYVVEEMAVFSVAVNACQSLGFFAAGYVIQSWAMPDGSQTIIEGGLYWDWARFYIICILNLAAVGALVLLRRMPNLRPHFGLSDFFQSMFAQPLRTMYRGRFLFDENERMRVNTARMLAQNQNPLSIDPLLSMLDDPSYDVRCEAITALARSESPTAAERLMEILSDKERRQLWDRVAWALGELQWQDAGPLLQQYLQDQDLAYRIRAMCARALGKIEDNTAVPLMVQILEQEHESLHFRSSCCCALLHLHAVEYAPLLLREINALRDRYDRYELLALACECMNIDARWLVTAKPQLTTYDMLDRAIQFRSRHWQKRHADAIDLFRNRDLSGLRSMLNERLYQAEGSEQQMLLAVQQWLSTADSWGPNVTLLAAWLIYNSSGH